MKRLHGIAFLLASGLVLSAAAQTSPAPAVTASTGPAKIAVITFQAAVSQTNEGQRNFTDIEKKYDPKRQQLKALAEEIDTSTKQLQAQGDKLTNAERASKAKTIDEKKKHLSRSAEEAQKDFQQAMQQSFNDVASKVYEVVASYAQQQGYTLVLDVSQKQNPVLYASDSTNITKAVIDAYNVKSGVPAPPAQPAGDAAPAKPGAINAVPPAH